MLSGAVHLRTGQPGDAARIDAWLSRHDVAVHGADDPFRLCVLVLQQAELAPDLACLGGAGLRGDDWSVLGYLRDTWPHIGIVVYGDPTLRVPEQTLFTCRSEQEWRHMTGGTPSALLRAMRCAGRQEPVTRPAIEVSGGLRTPDPGVGTLTAEELARLLDRRNEP